MSPALRKLALTIHLITSVGWVGAVIAYLSLGIAAVTSSDTETIRAAWTAMDVTGWWVIVPLAIGALVTGLVMSLGTRWGLIRHYWTLISLAVTVLCTVVLVLHMPSVSAMTKMASNVEGTRLRALGGDLFHPAVGLVLLLAVTVLNVYKPAGLTPYGWRKQRQERRALRTAAPERVTSADLARPGRVPTASGFSRLLTGAGYFVLHLAEMWFAMIVGMAAFIAVRISIGTQELLGFSEPTSIGFQVAMGAFMATPMAIWMRVRGCSWRDCGAMSAAMLLSTVGLLLSSAFAVRDAQLWLASNQHPLMLVGMLAFMLYRREHYTSGYSLARVRSSSRRRERVSA
jgi:hypothetical protein